MTVVMTKSTNPFRYFDGSAPARMHRSAEKSRKTHIRLQEIDQG